MNSKPICQVIHSQLLSGTCPWCQETIVGDQEEASGEEPRWNIERMAADLRSPDEEVRADTIGNLLSHSPPLMDAVPLLSQAIRDPNETLRSMAFSCLEHLGFEICDEQAAELEAGDEINEYPLAIRLVLLGYYMMRQFESGTAKQARRRNLLWLFANEPEIEAGLGPGKQLLRSQDPAGYEEAKAIWLAHVESNPKSPKTLANAAEFFVLNDFDLAERFMLEGGKLEPTNPVWRDRLGQLYSLQSMRRANSHDAAAAKGLAAYQTAAKLRDTHTNDEDHEVEHLTALMNRLASLGELAKAALAAHELEQARTYAEQLLEVATGPELSEQRRDDSGSLHTGHTILGRVAISIGDLSTAKRHLLASAKIKGAPHLVSFGPSMSLAKELLERNESQVVLEYFNLCREFWERGQVELDLWTAEVNNGQMPDFGPNLNY
ncbi:MAG: hypothetical protein WDZ51_13695 [Pirellulaceae bacterium]